jgi:hypothetical protein
VLVRFLRIPERVLRFYHGRQRPKRAAANSLIERELAPRARFELATLRLTAECSTIELPGNRTADLFHSNTARKIALLDSEVRMGPTQSSAHSLSICCTIRKTPLLGPHESFTSNCLAVCRSIRGVEVVRNGPSRRRALGSGGQHWSFGGREY